MKNLFKNIWGISFLQAVGASFIIWLWSTVMTNAENWISTPPEASQFAPLLIIPLIFIITATLAGSAILGYPLYLALNQKWQEAMKIIALTVFWLIVFTLIFISIL